MSRCEGLGLLALIAFIFLGFKFVYCISREPELISSLCLDFKDTTAGYDVVTTIVAILYLIYFVFVVFPECTYVYL